MQPYLFPYIGYFQLIQASDLFIFFDDVNYIKKGWINRNQILLSGKAHFFTLPIHKASQNRLINELQIVEEDKNKFKFLKLIRNAYANAQQFKAVYPLLEEIILYPESNLALFLENCIRRTAKFLGIKKKFQASSAFLVNPTLKGKDRIIFLCQTLQANTYVNPIGGKSLYDRDEFAASGIDLKFLQTENICYAQMTEPFIPNLSIIDIMMHTPPQHLSQLLDSFQLV